MCVHIRVKMSRSNTSDCIRSHYVILFLLANRNERFMTILAMLQLKKDSYFIISPDKFRIKRSKIEKLL